MAAATAGFCGSVHIPKLGMFTIGLLSKMFAAGVGHMGRLPTTSRGDGATPPVHINVAPIQTCCPMFNDSSSLITVSRMQATPAGPERSDHVDAPHPERIEAAPSVLSEWCRITWLNSGPSRANSRNTRPARAFAHKMPARY